MNRKAIALQFLAVTLAMTTAACAQTPKPAEPSAITPSDAAPVLGEQPGPTQSSIPEPKQQQATPKNVYEVQPGALKSSSIKGPMVVTAVDRVSSDEPQLLITSPMEPSARTEMIEDITVMDRLLRDAIGRDRGAEVMGIKLYTLRAAPMYIEDCAVIYRLAVDFPLAGSGASPATRATPASQVSAWDRAKRDIRRESSGTRTWQAPKGFTGYVRAEVEPPVFDPAKLDALIASIAKTLPEASHFRHLKGNEFIFVAISGADDAGAPKRLTLKAKKSDIDAAAAGQLTPDQFKERVARRVE